VGRPAATSQRSASSPSTTLQPSSASYLTSFCATESDPLATRLQTCWRLVSQNCSTGRFHPVCFRRSSRQHLSPVTEKAVGSRPIWREVIPAHIKQTSPSCEVSNDSSLFSSSAISVGENCCQNCYQHIALTTLLKLRCFDWSATISNSKHWIAAIWLPWRYSTFLQPSTRSTTLY